MVSVRTPHGNSPVSGAAQHNRLLREHRRLLELVARGEPVTRCLEELCLAVESIDPQVRACVLLADDHRTCFSRIVAPRFPTFAEALRNLSFGDGWAVTRSQVVVSGEPMICPDVAKDSRWPEDWAELCLSLEISAAYASPIVEAESLPLGSVLLCFQEPKEPTEWDLTLADMATGVAAIVLSREKSDEALASSQRALAAELDAARHLQDVSTKLIQADDIESLYDKILETAVAVMRADFASFQMLVPDRGHGAELRLLGHRGFDPVGVLVWEWVDRTAGSTCGMALRSGGRCVVRDIERCEEMPASDQKLYLDAGVRSAQTTPLVSRSGELIGMISTHWRELHEPSENEFRALDVLARQTADLIERMGHEAALEEANRRKDQFLATLAHELRNPLAPLRNALQVLKLKGELNEAAPESVEMMERQVDYIVRLVDDLLDVSRITRGTVELRKERVDLTLMIEEAGEAIRPTCENMEHELTVSLPTEPVYVDGDPTRLVQVVQNLLHNACKFTGRGGRIALRAAREGDGAVIRVQDNGAGIDPCQLPHVFVMFMQADTSLVRSGGGLGIGLTLVKDLVTLHGGTVEALSAGRACGSEFIVRLPIAPEPDIAQQRHAPDQKNAAAASRRVLVVDDNRDSADSLAEVLRMYGHDAHTAYDGLKAVSYAAELEPDLILLDIGLPKLDGYEAARRIRKQRPNGGFKLVALTGWGQEADRQQSVEAGFDRHVVKPIDRDLLEELLSGQ